jgi:hypothetical protein
VCPYKSWSCDAGTDRGRRDGSYLEPACFGKSAAVGLPLVWNHDRAIRLGQAVQLYNDSRGLCMRFAVRATKFAARLLEGRDDLPGIADTRRAEFSVTYRRTDGGKRDYVDRAELLDVSLVPRGAFRTQLYAVEPMWEWDDAWLASLRDAPIVGRGGRVLRRGRT